MYLLDTNVVSELRRARPHGGVLTWMRAVPESQLCLCAMTIGEIQAGIEITRSQDGARADKIEAWLDSLLATYDVIPLDASIMRTWARLMHRRSEDVYEDAVVAATALVHGFTVATRNTADFAGFGVACVNPFGRGL